MINETIATKAKLYEKKIPGTINALCEVCGRTDTLEHRIKFCKNSKIIWEWITCTIRQKLKLPVNDPEEILFSNIKKEQYQSKVALWLTTLGISFNLKSKNNNLENFIDLIREKRWNNRQWYRLNFNRWINVL